MRIVRTAAGMLLLTIGLPVLLTGGALWTAMQHRDAGGAFSGRVERITTPGHAVVVPDLDALLRRDAPFTRARDTRLRVTARTEAGAALVGVAPAEEVASYLAGAAYAQVDRVSLTSGPLPVRVTPVEGTAVPPPFASPPAWLAAGTGAVGWSSSEVRGQRLALVVMHPDARAGMTVDLRVEVRPGWLAPATGGLLVAGAVLIVLGMATLAWPVRRIAPLRPATLADVLPVSDPPPAPVPARPQPAWAAPAPMPVQPILAWPPHPSVAVTPAPLPTPPPGPPVSPGAADELEEREVADPDQDDAVPAPVAPEPAGRDLPGSADLATALGTLGSASPATRRRRTAPGLPTDPAAPPSVSPANDPPHTRLTAPRRRRKG